MLARPKSSSPTAAMIPQGVPSFATWSMKMAGAPLGNGPTKSSGSRKPSPGPVAMISTSTSPSVAILGNLPPFWPFLLPGNLSAGGEDHRESQVTRVIGVEMASRGQLDGETLGFDQFRQWVELGHYENGARGH